MKKFLKWALITVGAIVILAAAGYACMSFKIGRELSGFTPLETGHVVGNVYAVKDDFSNVYILRDSIAGYVVVDCGNSAGVVATGMQALGIDPADVTTVLLTHSDSDHVGALGLFPDAELYMAREEEQMIDGRTAKFLWFGNSLPRTDYTLIDDRQVFHVGGLKVEGILAPGHTAGMMAWLVNDSYLFSGDIASLKDGRIAPIPKIFDMDREQALGSMDIIRHFPTAEYIFTGHWGYAEYKSAVE